MREAAGGTRRVCGASSVKKNHDTLVVCRMQKCACAVQCVVRVSRGEQFTRHMLGVDAGRAVGSQSRAAQRVCQSRWCALSRRGRRWRACDFVGGRSFLMIFVYMNSFFFPGCSCTRKSSKQRSPTRAVLIPKLMVYNAGDEAVDLSPGLDPCAAHN